MNAQSKRLYHLGAKPIARSSLARLNEKQPAELYEALFAKLYANCQKLAKEGGQVLNSAFPNIR